MKRSSEEETSQEILETLQYTSDLVASFTPVLIKNLHKTIQQCFTSLKRHWKSTPKTIVSGIHTWTETLPIKKITESIERDNFTTEHHTCVEALKIMSSVFDMREFFDLKYMSIWPTALLKLYSSGRLEEYFTDETAYFNDILTVSLRLVPLDDVKKILNAKKGVSFVGLCVEGFVEVLTEEPFLLLEENLKACSIVLNDIVRLVVKKPSFKGRYENVLELVDKLWPAYEQHATFVQKHSLLVNLQCLLALGPDSNPLQWVTRAVCSQDTPIDQRAKLLCYVPEECFKSPQVASAACSLYPARLRELRPALLEAAAARPGALLPTLAALPANDPSTGWWDAALESCLASVAKTNSLDICVTLYHKCRSQRACERVLVPLLRHSSPEVCSKFIASELVKILGALKKGPRGDAPHLGYQKRWEEYMISLHLLLVAFEKLPTSTLESPTALYSPPVAPWELVRQTLRQCHQLRDEPCPATDLRENYRQLQCMLYKCMCAAICRRRPPAALYEQLVGVSVLTRVIGDGEWALPVRPSWTHRNKSMPVAVPLEPSALSPSPSHTLHSRIFLRTLSEDPMLFDLHYNEEEVMEVQDISLRETPLNAHEVAGTLTALLRHIAGSPTLACLWPILATSLKEAGTNLKWLLAQVVCNCREELKAHASTLLPGLLAVLSAIEDGQSMNGLHIDVLDTILYWREDTSDNLNVITHNLITTCMEHPRRPVFDGLVKTLHGWLELYGSIQVEWRSFEKYYEDSRQDTQKALFQTIKTICKAKIYIPQLLSKIVAKLDTDPSKVAECFGLAVAACPDSAEKGAGLGEFKKYLGKCSVITTYVKILYYASQGAAECCGEHEFRKIADYVTKVTSQDRTKCLHVLAAFLSRGRRGDVVTDMFDTIDLAEMIDKDHTALLLVKSGLPLMSEALKRRCIAQVAALRPATAKVKRLAVDVMLAAYAELFTQPPQPPAKRQRTESTPILSVRRGDVYDAVLTSLGVYAADGDASVAAAARDGIAAALQKEMGARFAECFLLTLYLPALAGRAPDPRVCTYALLDLFLRGVRGAEGFKELRLRIEPLPDVQEDSRFLTLTRSFQGTSRSSLTRRARPSGIANMSTDAAASVIDVQMPIDTVLENLLEFAKRSPEAARTLLAEVSRSVLSSTTFGVGSYLVPLLGSLLAGEPTNLTPLFVDVARALPGSCLQGLLAPAERLLARARGTEGAALAKLFYEDVTLRCEGDSLFQLGQSDDVEDDVMDTDEITTFSIEDLQHAFGRLSDWGDLTSQQRRAAVTALPPLWTVRADFVARLDAYAVNESASGWFDKMAAAYKQNSKDQWRWLRADRWPRRHFEISAITEALSWRQAAEPPVALLAPSDCLAESAARLMIRSAYHNSLHNSETEDRISALSRSHELQWCVRANEMGISSAVLQCVERNVEELNGLETLPWLRQKLLALRQQALLQDDSSLLRDVLCKAEKYTPELASDPSVSIEMYHLILQLKRDLTCLTQNELHTTLGLVERCAGQLDWAACSKEAVASVFQVAMEYYDEALETGSMEAVTAVPGMSGVVRRAAALRAPRTDLLLAVLLATLTGTQERLDDDLLEKLEPLRPTLDAFTLELLDRHSSSPTVLAERERELYRRRLQLVCDPGHALVHCCEELVLALRDRDGARWKSSFDRMKEKIYENPYAGPSFKLLDKYKDGLYAIEEFETTPEFATRAESALKSVVFAARWDPQSKLRLADLCPSLLRTPEGSGVEKWLGLSGEKVVRFYDEVAVFTDSIRRPVLLSALLSSGRVHRVLVKSGERLARDAAAQRVAAAAGVDNYSVTLLDEESAVIEYLEGHERLRTLISSVCSLDAVLAGVSRPPDHNLAAAGAASLQAHAELCARVPAHALRSALEQNSSCLQDFISMKRNFTESLADMTLLTWLLGLGDRHLQNILCSRTGRARSVDWGDVGRRAQAPPARLTRNLVAVADTQVLEARLQQSLGAARAAARLLEAAARVAFHWMGAELDEQMRHLRSILRGTASSYDVTRDITGSSSLPHREQFLQLLDETLADSQRDEYSVEQQVTCLLRHCTAPALLSVVRAGWEPWV